MIEIFTDKNAPYLITAYVVFLGGLLLYFFSLRMRRRSLDRDRQVLEQIEREAGADASAGEENRR
jgi:hypothetical protein